MDTHADKAPENRSQAVANSLSKNQAASDQSAFQLVDNRPEASAQKELQEMADNSPQMKQLQASQEMANSSQTAKLQLNQAPQANPIQKKENNTGLPDMLKTGMENISGMSLDDVKLHYNSDKPAQLQAHAYAQGADIRMASGQEKHLAHEAWHGVQQKQGREKPTMQILANANTNKVIQARLRAGVLNVVGENHEESPKRETKETAINEKAVGGSIWQEDTFRIKTESQKESRLSMLQKDGREGDPIHLRFLNILHFADQNAHATGARQSRIFLTRAITDIENIESGDAGGETHKAVLKVITGTREAITNLRKLTDIGEVKARLAPIIALVSRAINSLDASIDEKSTGSIVSSKRSDQMHQAANEGQRQGKVGVWKVGNSHVWDILDKYSEAQRLYSLTTKEEYDHIITAYRPGIDAKDISRAGDHFEVSRREVGEREIERGINHLFDKGLQHKERVDHASFLRPGAWRHGMPQLLFRNLSGQESAQIRIRELNLSLLVSNYQKDYAAVEVTEQEVHGNEVKEEKKMAEKEAKLVALRTQKNDLRREYLAEKARQQRALIALIKAQSRGRA